MAKPEFSVVNLLCGQLESAGNTADARLVGDLWKEKERLSNHEAVLLAKIQELGGEPPAKELLGTFPLVLYLPTKEDRDELAAAMKAMMCHPKEVHLG